MKKIKDIEYQNHVASENDDSIGGNVAESNIQINAYEEKSLKKQLKDVESISVFLDFDQTEVAVRQLENGYILWGRVLFLFSCRC